MKKTNKYFLLTSIVILSLKGEVLAMEESQNMNASSIKIKAKRPIVEGAGYNDDAVTLCDTDPIVLIHKDLKAFYNNIKVVTEEGTKKITVMSKYQEGTSYLLESKRFLVTPGDKVVLSYKIDVISGTPLYLGFLNTKRCAFYGNNLSLSSGKHTRSFIRLVPQDETETSVIFYTVGNKENPGHSSFIIENLGIEIQPKEK